MGMYGFIQPFPTASSHAPRAAETLNQDLATLDTEYNRLSDCMAQGERDGHDDKWLNPTGNI